MRDVGGTRPLGLEFVGARELVAGAYDLHTFNFALTGAVQAWVDATFLGNVTITSDYRIKKDVADLTSMWAQVKALRPIQYTRQQFTPPVELEKTRETGVPFIAGDDIKQWGFIAHELQATLLPSAATGVKDSPDTLQSIEIAPLVAALTKALQEAMARIEALETLLMVPR